MKINIILALAIPAFAGAEPTPLVSKLMNEPTSLLTFGLYRLESGALRNAVEAGFSFGSAEYNWDANEIIIYALSTKRSSPVDKKCVDIPKCELAVREGLEDFSSKYSFRALDGTWFENVTGKFTQSGYTSGNFHSGRSLDKAVDDLAAIIKISAVAYAPGYKIECKRSLKSIEIYCSRSSVK